MSTDIAHFFERFALDFQTFNGPLIATRYASPYLAVSATGEIQTFDTSEQTGHYFQSLLDDYANQGITTCRYADLEVEPITDLCQLATLSWQMLSPDGDIVSQWRESYNLLELNGQLRIVVSMDH